MLFLGDSIMRDVFTNAACLLNGIDALHGKKPHFMNNPHHGAASQIIYANVRDGPTLAFLWAHRVCARFSVALNCRTVRSADEYDKMNWTRNALLSLPLIYGGEGEKSYFRNTTNPYLSLVDKVSYVLYGGLAFTLGRPEAEANVGMALTWLRRHLRPSASIAVMETMPAHFPRRAFGEYDEHFHRHLPPAERRCEPHNATLAAAHPHDAFRRGVAVEFASRHALPLFRTWDAAASAHADHAVTSPSLLPTGDKRTGAFDCRHWCSPGSVMLAVVASFSDFLREARPDLYPVEPRP